MTRRTSRTQFLVPIWATVASPIRLLPANPNRELYSIQHTGLNNVGAAQAASIWIGPLQNVVGPAANVWGNLGQEVVSRGYVSDDTDQAEVWATCDNATGVRVVVQETVLAEDTKPPYDARTQQKYAGRQPTRRESRVM